MGKAETQATAKIAIADTETDPFEYGKRVEPFMMGFYYNNAYHHFWGDDCIKQWLEFIRSIDEPLIIFAHNGGKFDFMFFVREFDEDLQIINGRIMKGWIEHHQLRDSYGIFPLPLSAFADHKNFDMQKMKRENRENYRLEIIDYNRRDCVSLHILVSEFFAEFGDHLTIGQTAFERLAELQPIERIGERKDAFFRQFYYGGRCQCFASGIIDGQIKIFDVNNMYGSVMRDCLHPVSEDCEIQDKLTDDTDFAIIVAENNNAIPYRDERTGMLVFTKTYGEFRATGHEIRAAIDIGRLKIKAVKQAFKFKRRASFAEFIDHFTTLRNKAKKSYADTGDKMQLARSIFYKTIPNSSYGKLAQNPEDYWDWIIRHEAKNIPQGGCKQWTNSKGAELCAACKEENLCACRYEWEIGEVAQDWILWRRKSSFANFYNIATAASITGAARAVLLRGLSDAVQPLYCDTDSIICRDYSGNIDAFKVGAWKFEGQGDSFAIAGKKLYAVFANGKCIKHASKGVRITPEQIQSAARSPNVIIEYFKDSPNFTLNGGVTFIKRKVRATTQGIVPF